MVNLHKNIYDAFIASLSTLFCTIIYSSLYLFYHDSTFVTVFSMASFFVFNYFFPLKRTFEQALSYHDAFTFLFFFYVFVVFEILIIGPFIPTLDHIFLALFLCKLFIPITFLALLAIFALRKFIDWIK
jgi:hypothetical protein